MKFDDFKNEGSEAAVKVLETVSILESTCDVCLLLITLPFTLLSGCRKIQTART